MKKFAALSLALFTATSATAAPLTLNAPQTVEVPSSVIQVGGAEAEAIKAKYKAKFEQLKSEMKAEMEALKAKKQAGMKQRKGGGKKGKQEKAS